MISGPSRHGLAGRSKADGNIGRAGPKIITIRPKPGNPRQGLIAFGGSVHPCALGRGGISCRKREGDGATPLASMRAESLYLRKDRVRPPASRLPARIIGPDDGWCDDPADRNYNRPVGLPYRASHETMRRDDALYDYCVVLDWNRRPRIRGRGSAIFLHVARPGFHPTEGCIAVSKPVMRRLLAHLDRKTVIRVLR